MNTVNGANVANGLGLGMPQASQNKSLGQQDFLRLMVAQVQNQDPMEPKTNGDFLAQLAQFSTNDGITKMQESIANLSNSLQSNQALQASALVGRKVLVNSDMLNLGEEGDCKLSMEVPKGMSNLTAYVYSETGELLSKTPIGQKDVGLTDFVWNGLKDSGERMPAGKYKLKITGNLMGQEVGLKTMTAANVDSVSLGQNGEGVKLNVAGIGSVSLSDIKQITA